MRGLFVLGVAVAALAVAATASAHGVDRTVTADAPGEATDTYYLDVEVGSEYVEAWWDYVYCSGGYCDAPLYPDAALQAQVWRETNGCPGLQKTVTSCDGLGTPADERVA